MSDELREVIQRLRSPTQYAGRPADEATLLALDALHEALVDLVVNYATPDSYSALLRAKRTLGWKSGLGAEEKQ